MSTYKNCYALTASVRQALGEYSEAKVRGEDSFGSFQNDYIVEKINAAVRELYAMICKRVPGLFLGEVQLTGVNSVYSLPWDFSRLIWFKDNYGMQVYEIGERERRLTDSDGSRHLYRKVGSTLVLDQAGVSLTYTLIYLKKPRDIHHGLASAGSEHSITLQNKAPAIADYFNGLAIENVTQSWVDTISDYTAARVATIATNTAAKNDAYGLVPEIPEWSHHLVAPRAILTIRNEHPMVKRKPSRADWDDYWGQVRTVLLEHAAPSGDVDYEELFTSYPSKAAGRVSMW